MVEISVVVPAYNAERTINKTVEALLSQKIERSYEIIVIDDGSTDATQEILRKYPIKLISQKNAGPSAARNVGWKAASGEIVAFTDSDCVPVPGWLEALSKHFEDSSVGGVGGTYKTENPESILAAYIAEDSRFRQSGLRREIEGTGTYSAAFRKKLLEHVGGFDESYRKATAEDFDLCFAIRKTGHKIIYEPEAVVGHYHKESFLKYLKSQFWHAVSRVYLYSKYKNMAKGDQYTPLYVLMQVPISLLFLASFVPAFFVGGMFVVPVIFMSVLVALTVPFVRYEMRRNPLIAVVGVFMQLVRNIVWVVGFLCGLGNLVYMRFKNAKRME